MTRSRYRIYETHYPYFVTCTIVGWLPVFTRPQTRDIIYDCWNWFAARDRLQIYAYVILENHLHAIVSGERLSKDLGIFKSYTARQILDHLKQQRATRLLEQLRWEKAAHKVDRQYQVWQEGSQRTMTGPSTRPSLGNPPSANAAQLFSAAIAVGVCLFKD
jgi:REP element-mobilizing transposase RayT